MKKNSGFDLLFEVGLRHLYNAENEVFDALLLMAENAQSSDLHKILIHHREETSLQIGRLNTIFSLLDIDINSSKLRGMQNLSDQGKELFKTLIDWNFTDRSKGMDGIIKEGKELIRHFKKTEANDFALVSAGNKVENFEIGCYTSLCLLAEKLGQTEVFNLLQTSLKEEEKMEKKIRGFAENKIEIPVPV